MERKSLSLLFPVGAEGGGSSGYKWLVVQCTKNCLPAKLSTDRPAYRTAGSPFFVVYLLLHHSPKADIGN